MKSSSEDSFAWTNTSSDSDSDSPAMAHEEESDFDKSYKKKLQKELFENGNHEEPVEEEPRARKKKKKIKREPESPSPRAAPAAPAAPALNGHDELLQVKLEREKASLKRHRVSSGSEPARDAPTHERRPVRPPDATAERRASEEPLPHRKSEAKADRRSSVDETDAEPPRKKKKKKHKKRDESPDALIDKFEAEETVVESRRPASLPASPPASPSTSRRHRKSSSDKKSPERSAPEPPHEERRTVIRERITFQHDTEPEPESSAPPSSRPSPRPSTQPSTQPSTRASSVASSGGARLARYVAAHAHLAPVPPDAPHAALSAHDDVWLVRAPRGLPAAALAGAALTPGARRRLVAGGRTYETAPAPVERAALLRRGAEWRVRGLAVRGAVVLRERVPRVRAASAAPDAAPAEPDAVPLPATRRRHPLLGADFERVVPRAPRPAPRAASPPAAPRPLADSDVTDEREHKKKKKKRKRERDSDVTPAPAPAPEPEPRARARKRKRSERGEGRWDSERAIEENLFDF